MSKIRFANIPIPALPPTGKTWLFFDETDSHAKTIDSSGTIFDLTLSGGGGGGGVDTINSILGAVTIAGAGEVFVTTVGQTITVSGTPHETDTDTDTISDAIIGGVGITVTSGTSTTTIDGHLRYTSAENDAIVAGSNVTVVSGANTITISSTGGGGGDVPDALVGAGTVTVTSGTNTTTISGSTALTGMLHQIAFMKGESTIENDVFLNTYGDGRDGSPSNESPAVMPWKSKLVGLSYTNKTAGTKVHIEIQSVADGSGNSPVLMDFDWLLASVGVRTARKTNFTTDIIFDAGDKIAVFLDLKAGGANPRNVIVILYFEIVEETFEESSENFSGNLGTGAGGTS